MTALAPCPFCGGPVGTHEGHADITYITCDGCGVVASFRPHLKGRKAVEAWNRRASTPRADEAVTEWIAVSDRLPEERIRVMTFDGWIVRESFYGLGHSRSERWDEKCWRLSEQSETPVRDKVTHWRPLPAPPALTPPSANGENSHE